MTNPRKHARRDGLRKLCDHPPRLWGKDACLACPWYANEQLSGIPVRVNLNRLFNKENVSKTEAKGLLGDLQAAMRRVFKDAVKPASGIAEWQAQWRRKLIASIAGDAPPAAPVQPEPAAGLTVTAYACGWRDGDGVYPGWLAGCEARLKRTSAKFYRSNFERYVKPALGTRPLALIDREDCKALVATLDGKGLSRSSIRGVLRTLSAMLTEAMDTPKRTGVHANPALKTKGLIGQRGKAAVDADPFNAEDAEHLAETAREHFSRWYPLVLCGLRTGMRLGELLGLEWGLLDFRNRTIAVRQNWTQGALTTPKNHQQREVHMSRQLAIALRFWRRQLRAEFLKHGLPRPELVFPSLEGTYLDEANVRRVLRSICDKADLRRRSPHDLRHTFASLLLAKGEPVTYVSQQLGHKNSAITMAVYAKWIPSVDGRRGVDQLDANPEKVAKNLQKDRTARVRRIA